MPFVMQVKLVPSTNTKYSETPKQEKQIEYTKINQSPQTISDHSMVPTNTFTDYNKK